MSNDRLKWDALLLGGIACLVVLASVCVFTPEEESIQTKLAPYQAVIDRLNRELGTSVYIPEGTEEEVYQNLTSGYSSVAEFEDHLRSSLVQEQEEAYSPQMDPAMDEEMGLSGP